MTRKETEYIRAKAQSFFAWAEEERHEAALANAPEEREGHLIQARLNDNAGDNLLNLLADLAALDQR